MNVAKEGIKSVMRRMIWLYFLLDRWNSWIISALCGKLNKVENRVQTKPSHQSEEGTDIH